MYLFKYIGIERQGYSLKDFTLEVCVDSLESAVAATQGGATRLELCSNLLIGGTTPGVFLYREVTKLCTVPVHILIRPRFGDFCYTESELRIMSEDVSQFRQEGAQGVVIGVLSPDGSLNMTAMETLYRAADGMQITLHRAFDMCRNPFGTLKQAEVLGIGTILTSGQRDRCLDGAELIGELASQSQVDIMAGGGVTAEIIRELHAKTGISSYHLSGKVVIDSPMVFRNPNLSMGLPSLGEYELWRTSTAKIAAARRVLEEIE